MGRPDKPPFLLFGESFRKMADTLCMKVAEWAQLPGCKLLAALERYYGKRN